MLITVFTLALATSAADPTCSAGLRGEGAETAAAKIEVAARAGAGDPCPDHDAEGSPEQQSELLDKIRQKTLPRMDQMAARQIDAPGLVKKFKEMRLDLALTGARVRVDAQRKLIVEPSADLTHAGGLGKLDPLSDAERSDLDARIRTKVDAANARFASDARAGKDLLDQLKREGAEGYARLTSADPTLFYMDAPRDADAEAAGASYQNELRNGRTELSALATRPPTGAVVGMVYFGPGATEVLKARPELCGAFHSLLKKAGVMKRATLALKAMSYGVGTICRIGTMTIAAVIGHLSCVALTSVLTTPIAYLPSNTCKAQQLLYGVEPGEAPPERALTAELK